ncbi:uncharacterized protein MYCFIDRAFT_188967 [Pseudocercospora fijiensis CIRAD86]|uniref:non-specific serine/threonine protein kinase n=1 Tax=Pseudocercospora fijiensis (strain CIRAD86) TaxID=383855 RepID=M3ACC5_PSEFD|nr:uncharacterized protein MYCFIDRAFT_188967 [Pseudocercospora fijiensis CIRAD86]EME82206.1 hypothetical protein MYCFIDRAFT_188967 [Pseudocercospora fijiensis CIRAD86]
MTLESVETIKFFGINDARSSEIWKRWDRVTSDFEDDFGTFVRQHLHNIVKEEKCDDGHPDSDWNPALRKIGANDDLRNDLVGRPEFDGRLLLKIPSRLSRLGSLFGHSANQPRKFSTAGATVFSNDHKLEEENWEWYTPDAYFPVRIRQVFQSQYQVLGKLGYGAHPTAWLSRDLKEGKFVTLKVCERDSLSAEREVAAYEHLNSMKTTHQGALLVRELYDHFQISGSNGEQLSADVLKAVLKHLLLALDFLHTEAKMVHTDLQERNIHFRIEDLTILEDFEKIEQASPSARKIDGDRIIYESRGLRMPKSTGRPVLCDFGEARFGKSSYTDDIQPYIYRAPEIILDIAWSYPADIWNVGVMAWDLFERSQLFNARGPDGEQSSLYHLAQMVAILGPPPIEYLQRTETSRQHFETDGTWKAPASIPDRTLDTLEGRLDGKENIIFLDFIRKMLQWVPEERHTAKQLLEDPWLTSV